MKKLKKLYGDMIEIPDGYMDTAAEHDGWRPKRAVQAVCRHAEARHNGEMWVSEIVASFGFLGLISYLIRSIEQHAIKESTVRSTASHTARFPNS